MTSVELYSRTLQNVIGALHQPLIIKMQKESVRTSVYSSRYEVTKRTRNGGH